MSDDLTPGVYVVQGKMGSGKTLWMVQRMTYYLQQGRRVATNIDLNLPVLAPDSRYCEVFRLPDCPLRDDLDLLGQGYDGDFQDDSNGAIFLDEAAIHMNTREYGSKSRLPLIKLLVLMRKKRWDVYIGVQNVKSLDNQLRDLIIEYHVNCTNLGKIKIPYITSLLYTFSLGFINLKLPKMSRCTVRLGGSQYAPLIDSDYVFHRKKLFDSFNTEQLFQQYMPNNVDADKGLSTLTCGLNQLIPPYYLTIEKEKPKSFFRRLHDSSIFFFLIGVVLTYFLLNYFDKQSDQPVKNSVPDSAQVSKNNSDSKSKKNSLDKKVLDILSGVYITGSFFQSTRSCSYSFSNGDYQFYPANAGYNVKCLSSCKALLYKADYQQYVYCNPLVALSSDDDASLLDSVSIF